MSRTITEHEWLGREHNDCCSCGWRCAFNGSGTHFISRCKQAHARHAEYGIPTIPEEADVELVHEAICEECNHPIRLHHENEGCEYERGDAWVEGKNCGGWVAQGPCGCQGVTIEPEPEMAETFEERLSDEPNHAR